MTKRQKAAAKRKRAVEKKTAKPTRMSRYKSAAERVISAAVIILGIPSALSIFLPRLTIDMAALNDPSNEFAIATTIQNTGFIPLEDVNVSMGLCEIDLNDENQKAKVSTSACEGSLKSRLTRGEPWHVPHMPIDQKFSLTLGDLFNFKPPAKLTNADISIVVSYRPAFWPFHFEKEAGYKSRLRDDGKSMDWFFVPR